MGPPSFETCGPSSSSSAIFWSLTDFDSGREEAETDLTGFPASALQHKI